MINHPYFDELREKIRTKNEEITTRRKTWIKNNSYYYRQLINSLKFIIEPGAKILHIRCSVGFLLNELSPSLGVGVDDTQQQINEAKKSYPHLTFYNQSAEQFLPTNEVFDYVLISSIEDIVDIKAVLDSIKPNVNNRTRIIITHYNYLWNPLVKLAERLNMKLPQKLHNWISFNDLTNFLQLSGYEGVINRSFILIPFNIPIISYLVNRFFARLPFFNLFTMMRLTVARLVPETDTNDYSVSIVIPCRNEAGNIEDAVTRIPKLGSNVEIIFGDDKSTDGTPEKVKEMMAKYPEKNIRLVNSPGICKAYNVWTCFDAAKNDILMILDADLTVVPEELPYFYEAIAKHRGEFINGSRLVYPMHNNAMPFFNTLGNKFFSLAFTYILDTPIKDTLCGTKVIWRSDFEKVKKLRGTWGVDDRWGDYELIFGAAKQHLKIIDLPVHYYERVYGETKMTNRVKNGLVMLKMCRAALMKIKFNF
ncbi:MAG: glycosyltransferase [Bacteroidia bacterium]|nr:glycosyltransferase [Bacteroidia bacterium]